MKKKTTKKVLKKASPHKKKKKVKRATSTLKKYQDQARVLIDESLSAITPALKASLEDVKSQLTVGDLRSLGLRVFERAKTISDKVRSQVPPIPAVAKKKTSRKK